MAQRPVAGKRLLAAPLVEQSARGERVGRRQERAVTPCAEVAVHEDIVVDAIAIVVPGVGPAQQPLVGGVSGHPDVPAPADDAAEPDDHDGIARFSGRRDHKLRIFAYVLEQSDGGNQPRLVLPQQFGDGCELRERNVLRSQLFLIDVPYGKGLQNRNADRFAGFYQIAVGQFQGLGIFRRVGFRLGVRLRLGVVPVCGLVVVVAVFARRQERRAAQYRERDG